jgi:hypothetical protein
MSDCIYHAECLPIRNGGVRMKYYMTKKKITLPLAFILIIITVLLMPYKQALLFEYQDSQKVLAYIPFKDEQNFKIKYTHSIHLTDVVESYRVTPNRDIQQYELMFEDFAVGMPSNAAEGETFEVRDGKYFIKNMNKVFPFFDLRIGQVRANHTVIYKKGQYPLSRYIQPGTRVRVIIKKVNILQQMRGVNILEQ